MKKWEDNLSKAAIALALLGFLMTFAISYRSAGMAEGLQVGDANLDEFRTEIGYKKIQFSGDGEGTYVGFARYYGWLTWLFGIVTLSTLVGRVQQQAPLAMTGLVIALVSGLLILYQLRQLIRDKAFMEPYFWEAPRNRFAFQTIIYDWLLVGPTCFLIMFIAPSGIVLVRKVLAERTNTRIQS